MRIYILFVFILVHAGLSVYGQTCPDYTKNRDPLEPFSLGVPAQLPSGFVAFNKAGTEGLYMTPTQTYAPQVVRNTQFDDARSIDVSSDGQWLLYITGWSQLLTLLRVDGSGKATKDVWGTKAAGFYRESPFGTEIFYLESNSVLVAMRVDLSGQTAVFLEGTKRTIADIGYEREFNNNWYGQICVSGDRIFTREQGFVATGYLGRTCFITIPDSGRGTASFENIYQWANDSLEAVWGCGHTMSHDGSLCLANSALVGSVCVPNRKNDPMVDHKGFYVTRFWRGTDVAVEIDEIADVYGISINWAPPPYRLGTYDEVDFTSWSISNAPYYVVGALRGSRLADYGLCNALWIVEWTTNTWTRLTPDSLFEHLDEPVMFITDSLAVGRSPALGALLPYPRSGALLHSAGTRLSLPLHSSHGVISLFSLDGRRMWTQNLSVADGARLAVPHVIAAHGVYVYKLTHRPKP